MLSRSKIMAELEGSLVGVIIAIVLGWRRY